jgi:hypothetical protein
MTVVTATTNTWLSVAAGSIQVRGGRVRLAASASPAANDWLTLPDGTVYDLRNTGYVQAEKAGTIIVSVNL